MLFDPRAATCRRVLLIEDDPGSRLLLARALETRHDVDLVEATSAMAGVAAITTAPPHLIILDSQLPDMPGTAVLQWLRQEPTIAGIPVIVVSADARRATIDRMLAVGANDYLTKPVELPRLFAAIDRLTTTRSDPSGCPVR